MELHTLLEQNGRLRHILELTATIDLGDPDHARQMRDLATDMLARSYVEISKTQPRTLDEAQKRFDLLNTRQAAVLLGKDQHDEALSAASKDVEVWQDRTV